jgi:hypothetical protein
MYIPYYQHKLNWHIPWHIKKQQTEHSVLQIIQDFTLTINKTQHKEDA